MQADSQQTTTQPLMPPELAQRFNDASWGAEQLKSVSIFRCFSHDELKKIYQSGKIITFKPGSHIVIEGEPTRGLYIVMAGTVSVYKTDEAKKNMYRLAYLETGANFGELSLFDTAPRSATVAAETICHMFYLDVSGFDTFLDNCKSDLQIRFFRSCSEELAERFRRLNGDYVYAQKLLWKHALRKSDDDKG